MRSRPCKKCGNPIYENQCGWNEFLCKRHKSKKAIKK